MIFSSLMFFAAAHVGATFREIKFRSKDGFELHGILEWPAGAAGKLACIVMHPGSGPTDRDGNQPHFGFKTNLMVGLGEAIRSCGVATFRFDKRAAWVYRESWPQDKEKYNAFFSWDHHLEDYEAAIRTARAAPEVDPHRIGLLGHSEGGLFSLAIAKQEKVGCLMLLGTPGRPLDVVLVSQVSRSLDRQKVSPAVKAQYMAEVVANCRSIKEHSRLVEPISPGLKSLFNFSIVAFLHGLMNFSPVSAIATFGGPVLVMNGREDIQVDPVEDFLALKASIKRGGNKGAEFLLVDHASHNFKVVSAATEPGLAGPIAPVALDGLVRFMRRWAKSH